YDSEIVPNRARTPGTEHFWGLNNPGLSARLESWNPQAVLLFGYKYASHLRTIAWARRRGVPIIFRGDSHLLGRPRPGWLQRCFLRWVFRQFRAVTCVGAANRDYFRTFSVPERKLFFVPHCVDHSLYDPSRQEYARSATALRTELGIAPDTRVVLFAGKFVADKQPRELLEAFVSLRPRNAALLFAGDGPEKDGLVASAAAQLDAQVRFLPFANQSEMPARYAAADVFALPSRGHYETWGLAVNEAMHMGLPCIVSDRVGCQQDLVTEGETGWVFHATDAADLRDKLGTALTADLAPYRPRIATRIAGYTYEIASAGLAGLLGTLCDPQLKMPQP
ncbi:MAG: glycosyltransferase family 4 protein, partial [Opitutus sp.]